MLASMPAKLYVVPASHPSASAERALQIKGIEYRKVFLVPVFHKAFQKARFREGSTVPGVILDGGRKVLGSRAIVRALEDMHPQPPLFPSDPDARRRVEEAEAWGDEVLQPLVRRVIWKALAHDRAAVGSYAAGVRLFPPTPAFAVKLTAGAVSWAEGKINKATDEAVKADLASLPGHLDRVDAWLAEGVLGSEPVNAADLQIATGLRLLLTMDDVAPQIDVRPAGAFARRAFPEYQGNVPAGALSAYAP
jgi:glutathione S-transferase